MNIIDLEQGTPEWLEWRRGKATASDAAIIMGDAPSWFEVRTWDDLRVRNAGLATPPSPRALKAFEHGHKTEPIARAAFEAEIGKPMPPACIEMERDGRFAASLDGFDPLTSSWAEIKSPISGERSKLWRAMENETSRPIKEQLQPYVWWQLVHQAMVIFARTEGTFYDWTCYLVCHVNGENRSLRIGGDIFLSDGLKLYNEWRRFLSDEEQYPPNDFSVAAEEWLDAHAHAEKANNRLKKAREVLIASANDTKVVRDGVNVSYGLKTGAVDWKDLAYFLYGIATITGGVTDSYEDFKNRYRKPSSSVWTVRKANS